MTGINKLTTSNQDQMKILSPEIDKLAGIDYYTTSIEGIGGQIKKNFADFFVREIVSTEYNQETVNRTETVNGTLSNNGVTNTTSYDLSNFVGNSVQQQNNDVTYSGKIDVVKEISSNNATISDETNNYNGIGVSLTLIDNRVLFINFDTQSPLSKDFVNAPIVGLAQ